MCILEKQPGNTGENKLEVGRDEPERPTGAIGVIQARGGKV